MIERPRLLEDEDFGALLAAASPRVFAYIRVSERRLEDAEGVMGETVERAYRAWSMGKRPRGEGLPWLLLIARRLIIDRSRRRMLMAKLLLRRPPDHQDRTVPESEERLWFGQLAAVLTARQFEALVLRYLFDLGDREIGGILRLSPSGSRTLISRAIATLRAHPEVTE